MSTTFVSKLKICGEKIYDLHPYSSPFFFIFLTAAKSRSFVSYTIFFPFHQFFSFVTLHFHLIYFHFYFYGSFQTLKYPKSVAFIISNEFCERFNYYGMRSEYIINPISIEGREKPKCDSDMNRWKEAFYESRSISCFFFALQKMFFPVLQSISTLTSQQK